MSHCISVLLLRKMDVQNELKSIPYVEMKNGIIALEKNYSAFLEKSHIKYLSISTDYFGGCGEQECKMFDPDLLHPVEYIECNSINDGLRRLGINKTPSSETTHECDEFDTIGLGNYRRNSDFKFKKDMGSKEDLRMSFFDWIRKIKSTHFKNN